MRIIDRYILTELAGPFFFGIASFTSIFIGTDVLFKIARYITQYGASIFTVTKLFVYSLPGIAVLTFPMSMLLASLLSFARLSANSEIVAMKTGGISFYRLAAPVFAVAFCVSIFTVVFNELVVPAANQAYRTTIREEIEKKPMPQTQDHVLIRDIKNGQLQRILYARKFNNATDTMQGVDVQEFADGKLARIINAEEAVWAEDRWILTRGVMYEVAPDGRLERMLRFEKQRMAVDKTPQEIVREQKRPEEMTIRELKTYIKLREREYADTNALAVELHQRLAVPMASLIFTIVGAPLGLQPHRASSSIGLGLSIVIIFIYYSIMTIGTALGQSATIPPVLGAWLPNLIMAAVGLGLVRRAAK